MFITTKKHNEDIENLNYELKLLRERLVRMSQSMACLHGNHEWRASRVNDLWIYCLNCKASHPNNPKDAPKHKDLALER